jgi:hypothetical protein
MRLNAFKLTTLPMLGRRRLWWARRPSSAVGAEATSASPSPHGGQLGRPGMALPSPAMAPKLAPALVNAPWRACQALYALVTVAAVYLLGGHTKARVAGCLNDMVVGGSSQRPEWARAGRTPARVPVGGTGLPPCSAVRPPLLLSDLPEGLCALAWGARDDVRTGRPYSALLARGPRDADFGRRAYLKQREVEQKMAYLKEVLGADDGSAVGGYAGAYVPRRRAAGAALSRVGGELLRLLDSPRATSPGLPAAARGPITGVGARPTFPSLGAEGTRLEWRGDHRLHWRS